MPSVGIAGILSDALAHPHLLVAEASMPFWDWLSEQPADPSALELWQAAAASALLRSACEDDLDEDEIYDLDLFRRNTAGVVLGYAVEVIGVPMVSELVGRLAQYSSKDNVVEVTIFGLSSIAAGVMQLSAAEQDGGVNVAVLSAFGALAPLRGERHAATVAKFVGSYG